MKNKNNENADLDSLRTKINDSASYFILSNEYNHRKFYIDKKSIDNEVIDIFSKSFCIDKNKLTNINNSDVRKQYYKLLFSIIINKIDENNQYFSSFKYNYSNFNDKLVLYSRNKIDKMQQIF